MADALSPGTSLPETVGVNAPPADAEGFTSGDCIALCIFAHGMGGNSQDWKVWVESLTPLVPDWTLFPLELKDHVAPLIGEGLDVVADIAAGLVIEAARAQLARNSHSCAGSRSLTLHCIGHSMGGVILRGALPNIFAAVPDVEAGVFMSLSSPHLGVQASWGAPQDMWRNLSFVLRPFSPQIPQLAIQDKGTPYLVGLADPDGPYVVALRKFRRRICMSMGPKDLVIPTASACLWAERPWTAPIPPARQIAGWGFEAMSSYIPEPRDADAEALRRSFFS